MKFKGDDQFRFTDDELRAIGERHVSGPGYKTARATLITSQGERLPVIVRVRDNYLSELFDNPLFVPLGAQNSSNEHSFINPHNYLDPFFSLRQTPLQGPHSINNLTQATIPNIPSSNYSDSPHINIPQKNYQVSVAKRYPVQAPRRKKNKFMDFLKRLFIFFQERFSD